MNSKELYKYKGQNASVMIMWLKIKRLLKDTEIRSFWVQQSIKEGRKETVKTNAIMKMGEEVFESSSDI